MTLLLYDTILLMIIFISNGWLNSRASRVGAYVAINMIFLYSNVMIEIQVLFEIVLNSALSPTF